MSASASRSRARSRTGKRAAASADADPQQPTPVEPAPIPYVAVPEGSAPKKSVLRTLLTRMAVGLVMIVCFLGILYSHHWVVVGFVGVVQVMSFRELLAVRHKEVKEQQIPWFRSLSWLAFAIVEFAAYGQQVLHALRLTMVEQYHPAFTFGAFVVYFTMFVLSLRKKKLYKYQITQLAWTWMVLLMVVGQAWGTWWNIFHGGIIWFLLPASLIVCNDIWAYFTGLAFGRRFIQYPFLEKLSPNKTWEGFLGGFFVTLLLAPVQVYLYQLVDFWVCPYSAVAAPCVRSATFLPVPWSVAGYVVHIAPVYLHGFVFAIFASLIAPFGGFFASGVKRAFGKKDFDTLFPGHGGVVDRMDCQMIMQLFVWTYLRTFVFPGPQTMDAIVDAVLRLPLDKQQAVLQALHTALGQ